MKGIGRKLLAAVCAALLLAACDQKEKEDKTPEPPKAASMLSLVPEDTIFFSGGLEPAPLKEWLQWTAERFKISKELLRPQEMQELSKAAETDGQRLAVQLWEAYLQLVLSPDTQFASWGFEEKPLLASYAVGLTPVLLRIRLQDVQRFNSKIAELEEKAKVTAKPETVGQAVCRRYPLNQAKDEKEPQVSLVIGVDGADAVFLLDLGVDGGESLAAALGQRPPEKSLEQSGRLAALHKQYGLHPAVVGYIDHQQIITGLTTKDGNRMAKMLQLLIPRMKKEAAEQFAALQSEGCRNDLQAIAASWPQTVMGYTAFDLQAKPARIDFLMAVESTDKALLDGLASLRGVVPDYSGPAFAPAVVSAGIGLSMENVGPFLMRQWTAATQKQYSCGFLKELQAELKEKNPAAAGMAAGMAAGVRGLSFSLLSLTLEKTAGSPAPKELDAILSLAAKDPAALAQTISSLLPQLEGISVPADGSPVKLPTPGPLPFTPMAAVNGSHLTVYAGKKAELLAKELGKMPLESSQGVLAWAFDYGGYFALMRDILPSLGQEGAETAKSLAVLEAMQAAKMRMRMQLDFTGRGIELRAGMTAEQGQP